MIQPRTLFRIRFVTLSLLILGSLGSFGWAISSVVRTEPLAQEWAGDLLDRMTGGLAQAQQRNVFLQDQILSQLAHDTRELGGDDLPVRMDNLERLHDLLRARTEASGLAYRLTHDWSPITWWTNPITGRKLALNATPDGRIDPQVVAALKASTEMDLAIALARERAAIEAPLSPAERVARDLAKLQGGK